MGIARNGTTVAADESYTLAPDEVWLVLVWDEVANVWNDIDGTGNDLDNRIDGNPGVNHVYGMGGNDLLYSGGGNDVVDGGAGNDQIFAGDDQSNSHFDADTIFGGAGNDELDGGLGADSMDGGTGDDVFFVRDEGDEVIERAGEGLDLVLSWIDFTLPDHVEEVELYGSALVAIGNGLDNFLQGNAADNLLEGQGGNDELEGQGGNDTLRGGTGWDTMWGGAGDDVYEVDSTFDAIEEYLDEGNDIVRAYVDWTLGDNVEILELAGTALNGTGNVLHNTLQGNQWNNLLDGKGGDDTMYGAEGDDTLRGGAGADSMEGGTGNDTYVVDSTADVLKEAADEGTDVVQASVTFALGAHLEQLTLTGTAAINGTGNTLANTLTGNAVANVLDGGAGADAMAGGAGNDTYLVDNVGDTVTEAAGAGTDHVRAGISYTLGANLEKLTLTGTTAINGTGNTLANVLNGNAAANVLNGGAGADTMAGGAGNDTYVVDNGGDAVTEAAGAGTDRVRAGVSYTLGANLEQLTLTGTAAINGTGNSLANTLTGNAAANVLDGGAGADAMAGGAGNDTYLVDNVGDTVTEAAGAGTDHVRAGISYTLGANLEKLTLTGTAAINGTGNTLANVLNGNAAANVLNGGAGADTMAGGAGNDTYVIDNAGDRVTETSTGGIDTVKAGVTHTLANYVEHLTLTGSAAINATGNTLANVLTGNAAANVLAGAAGADTLSGGAGNDTLVGGAGNDRLTGGTGRDFFVFDAALNATANVDTIVGFLAADDTIRLENAIFTRFATAGVTLSSSNFKANAAGIATDSNDYIVYDTDSGNLFYDADGSGAGAAVLFASLVGAPALTAADFVIV